MTTPQVLNEVLSPALVRGVGYALLHSLWQGAVLALLLAGALPLLRRHRAEVRYAAAVGTLAALVLAVGLTFGSYYHSQPAAPAAPEPAAHQLASSAVASAAATVALAAPHAEPGAWAWLRPAATRLEAYLPLLVITWLLGLLLMSGRLAGGLLYTRRLRQAGTQALGAEWQRRLAALAQRAGVRRPVALLESARVAGPLVLGHLRPVILLPLGAVAGLSPALLEALLAHELAHIVRRDYLLNLVVAVAEVLFFYHPAVWFMAACLRAERENCCDDQAAALCGGDRLRVARALAALAELEAVNVPAAPLALAAAGVGGRGSLLARVRRLALGRPQAPSLGEGLLALLLGVVGVAGLSTGVALAAPAAGKAPRALLASLKQTINLTTHKSTLASATLASAEAGGQQVCVSVATDNSSEARAHTYSPAQTGPPRRGSTVVIEKDKKGRIMNLVVDGQSIEAGRTSKKTKRKKVRTTEIVRVPERPIRVEGQGFRFNFSPKDFPSASELNSEAQRAARRGLTDALRNPDLSDEERQSLEKALGSLGASYTMLQPGLWRQQDAQRQWQESQRRFQEGQRQLQEGQRRLQEAQRQFQLRFNTNGMASLEKVKPLRLRLDARTRSLNGLADANQAAREAAQADREAAQAERAAAQAEREAAQADREAALADQEGAPNSTRRNASRSAELAARRAELRARMAADAAELRALEGEARRSVPRPPRAPQAPLPAVPEPPQEPVGPTPPPPPPAPNTTRLREELLRDGLIKDRKHYSFQLNNKGGQADGRALTPEQVTKYRRLFNQPTTPDTGKTKSNFSIGITVDEN